MSRSFSGRSFGKTELERVWNAREQAAAHRAEVRSLAVADPICICGWITARDICPSCGGVRVLSIPALQTPDLGPDVPALPVDDPAAMPLRCFGDRHEDPFCVTRWHPDPSVVVDDIDQVTCGACLIILVTFGDIARRQCAVLGIDPS